MPRTNKTPRKSLKGGKYRRSRRRSRKSLKGGKYRRSGKNSMNRRKQRGGMERSVSRARSPSPAPRSRSGEWIGSPTGNYPLTSQMRGLMRDLGQEEPDFSEKYKLTEEDIIERERELAAESMRKAKEHLENINRIKRDKQLEELLESVNSMISSITSTASPLLKGIKDSGKKLLSTVGQSAYKNILAPGIGTFYRNRLNSQAVGTPEYDETKDMLETIEMTAKANMTPEEAEERQWNYNQGY
jgi:hypothetical protein